MGRILTFDQAYASGADDDDSGFIEYGPGDIQAQLVAVNQFLTVVNQDMIRETKDKDLPQMYHKWDTEVWRPWVTFFASTQRMTGSPSLLRDSTYRRAEAFRQLGVRYRENLEKKEDSGTVVTPTKVPGPIQKPIGKNQPESPLAPSPGVSLQPKSMNGFPWKWVLIGGGVLAGGYLAWKFWPGRRAVEMIAAPTEHIRNPPPWVQDADIWESAKLAVEPYKGRYDNPDAVITHVYKQMGGRIG
jgi:hypothetical protein